MTSEKNNSPVRLVWKEKRLIIALLLWGILLVVGSPVFSYDLIPQLGFIWVMALIPWIILNNSYKWQLNKQIIPLIFGSLILVSLFLVFFGEYSTKDFDPCNKLSFYPPFEEKENRIQAELREHYGHNVWLNCGGDAIGEKTNVLWSTEGDIIDCKMMCSLYHRTEWYYTPVYFWFEYNYSEYKIWDDGRRYE